MPTIYFICKALPYLNVTPRKSSIPTLCSIFQLYPYIFSPRYCTISVNNEYPFPVSYLTNTCGFSLEDAVLVSKRVQFSTPEKPDSVINFFKKHGFLNHHLLGIIKYDPSLLLSKPEKTILPKFEFFYSKGVSSPGLVKIFSMKPRLLRRSLKNHLVPSYMLLRSSLQNEERLLLSIQSNPAILAENLDAKFGSNVSILRGIGGTGPNIEALLRNHPHLFIQAPDKLKNAVEEVKKLGFDPSKYNFFQALGTMTILGKSMWKKKFGTFLQWGWTEEEVFAAFRLYPWIMATSEAKITAIMHLFVNHLGVAPSALSKKPVILGLSLERRLIPRASVIQFLLSKCLLTKESSWLSVFIKSDKFFLETFVKRYKEEAPQLLKLYEENMDFSRQQTYLYHGESKI